MMLLIDNVLIPKELFSNYFICNIERCKGICCIEGDYGAPVTEIEENKLNEIKEKVLDYLPEDSREYLLKNEATVYYPELKTKGTPLHDDGRCVYATIDKEGIVGCGIEQAWADGKVDWRKPVSCHLYPIRIEKDYMTGFDKLEYDIWDICSPACVFGESKGVKVYQFLKEALIRKYGEEFYARLEDADEQNALDR